MYKNYNKTLKKVHCNTLFAWFWEICKYVHYLGGNEIPGTNF